MRDSIDLDRQRDSHAQILPARLVALFPSDGWLTFLLTVLVIWVTVASIQSVRPAWSPGLSILTGAMFLGIAMGYVATEQKFIGALWVHALAAAVGITSAVILSANAVLNGDKLMLLRRALYWLQRTLSPQGARPDNSVFLLFLTLLTFLLAYLTVWLVFHARRPWLALVANAVVLLINIDQSTSDQYYFLIVYLVLILLLLVRFTLAEHLRQWRRANLRFSPDLAWDVMQAGVIFAVIVAILPNLLPFAQPNQAMLDYLNSPQNPLSQIQQRFNSLFAGTSGNGQNSGFFDSNLQLVGSVNLPDTPILRYTLPASGQRDATQYLITEAFSTYDGQGSWSIAPTIKESYPAGRINPSSSTYVQLDAYTITFLTTPSGGERYIFAPGSGAASFSIPSNTLFTQGTNEPVTWLAQRPLGVGATYTGAGYVSTATVSQLEHVAYPKQAQVAGGASEYPATIVDEYTAAKNLDSTIVKTAYQVTQGATNMYDAATDIENYLHKNFKYSTHNPDPPPNEDPTVWFLQRKVGFCTFFATAMALMGRALGMPTRIVGGYAAGNYDAKSNSFIVRGTQAHTWTQIYFGKYGWINFEPTASFPAFQRAIDNGQSGGANGSQGGQVSPTVKPGQGGRTARDTNTSPLSPTNAPQALIQVALGLGLALLFVLIALGAALLWWRSRFRSYSPVAASFARLILLGVWAGAPPQRSQTPREYAHQLGSVIPTQRETVERVGALYSRERWGTPLSAQETTDVSTMYERGRTALATAIWRRVRDLPAALAGLVTQTRRRLAHRDDTPLE